MPDIDAIEEQHYEQFHESCASNSDLDDLVWEHFADRIEQYRYWKEGISDDSPYKNAFDILYDWNAEYLVSEPMECLIAYLEENE